ncbi:MAG: c-type cytochrome [Phycisphaerales bacterium]|nr:c-type cytochrome [Phycisphaerales bacterium]
MAKNKTDSTLIQDHVYDGIMEYDNPTPGWWHIIFLLSIVFSGFYFLASLGSPYFIHQTQRLADAKREKAARLLALLGDLQNTPEQIMDLAVNRPDLLQIAESTFRGNCASCHGANAGGLVGPNLTDDSWKNIKDITGIAGVITNGAGNGAMPAWGKQFQPSEIVLLSAYIASLRGSNPAGGKSPEGEVVPAWPPAPPPKAEEPTQQTASAG